MDARCYGALVVTTAPEAAGRIVELPVVDNKYVHKGDLLMVIDPTNYTIAVSQATAARAYEVAVRSMAQSGAIGICGHRRPPRA